MPPTCRFGAGSGGHPSYDGVHTDVADEKEDHVARTDNADRTHIGPEGYSDETTLPSIDELQGMDVCDITGERIGTVDDAYTDAEGSFVRYIAVATGWLGGGRRMIPIDDVRLEADDAGRFLMLPYEESQLRDGPSFDRDQDVTRSDEGRIYGHYGRAGYWDALRARQTPPAPTQRIAEAELQAAIDRGEDPNAVAVRRWGI